MTTAYITKCALTTGIFRAEGKVNGELFRIPGGSYFDSYYHGNGKEWHLTEEAALARAEEMRIAKLKSLNKQMKKISALKFEIK